MSLLIFKLVFFVLFVIYVLLILLFCLGFRRFGLSENDELDNMAEVTVIVAFRDEEDKIAGLLKSLQKQKYPKDLLQFIFVNDHSSDKSAAIVEKYFPGYPIMHLYDNENGKKAALKRAVASAKTDILVFTDADCTMTENWLRSIVSYFERTRADMVVSPVLYRDTTIFITRIFAIEFLSLVASGYGAAGVGKPIMANGANFAFRKSALENYDKESNAHVSSGDDVFLLHSFKKRGKRIFFNNAPAALVETDAPQGIADFFRQRFRWASKSKHYADRFTLFVAFVVFFENIALTVLLTAACIFPELWIVFFVGLGSKSLIDIVFLVPFIVRYERKYLLYYLLPVEILYFIYITLTALSAMTLNVQWKGRTISK